MSQGTTISSLKNPLHWLHRWVYQGLEDLWVWRRRLDVEKPLEGLGNLIWQNIVMLSSFLSRELYRLFGTFGRPTI